MKIFIRYGLIFGTAIAVIIFLVAGSRAKITDNNKPSDNSPYVASVTPFILFDGDANPAPGPSCYEYATEEQGTGVGNSASLKLTPDQWHAPVLKVFCVNNPRKDLGLYENINFMIRASTETADPISLSFWTFAGPDGYAISKDVSVNQYIQSGSIGTAWKQVTIPISVFKTSSWDLSKVDAMSFSVSSSNSIYYMDNIIFQPEPETVSPPTVTLTPLPYTINSGDSSVLTWSSTNTTGCSGKSRNGTGEINTPRWTGTILTSGTETVFPTVNTIYEITCTGKDGSSISPHPVKIAVRPLPVVVPPSPPTATLSASSYIIDSGQPVTITWSSANTTSCTGTRGWTGTKATSGSQEIRPTQTAMYAMTCTGKDGSQILPYLQIRIEVNPPTSTPSLDLSKQLKIWTGESAVERSAGITRGSVIPGGANSSAYSLSAVPDQYNGGNLSLANISTVYRKSLSQYDFIQMTVKVTPNAGTTLPTNPTGLFNIYGWPHTSASIKIQDYVVDGGALGTSYRMIRIPVNNLRVANGFDLSSMENLLFSLAPNTSPTYTFQVDEIYAVKTSPNDVLSILPISNKALKLVTKDRYDMNGVTSTSNYNLTSTGDMNFSSGKSPIQVGREFHVSGFETSSGGSYGLAKAPIFESNLYLVFDTPLSEGVNYKLTIQNIPDLFGNNFASPKNLSFTYSGSSITNSVQVNQVGYLPVSPKFAYIGNYIGDAGSLGGVPSKCRVVNATSSALVAEFPAVLRASDLSRSGNNVYNCDFSSITAPGSYYIDVPGFGRSYSFKIGSDVYNDVLKKLMNFYYGARANVPINYGQWSRPAGTLSSDQSAMLHPVNYVSSSDNPLPVSYADYPLGTKFDMTGGWYDAGDYGKYILPAAAPINELLLAYELYPQKFIDGQADIPEKNNGIPDILDEVKFEIDWFQKMQANDGGVFDRLTSQQWEKDPYDIQTRYLAPKSTHTTAVYAAVLAQASRVFKNNAMFESKYPGYADALLLKAGKAWNFLVAHPTPLPANGIDVRKLGIGGGDYQDTANSNCSDNQIPGSTCPYSDVDNRAWAAAELYKTTGNSQYGNAFKTYWPQTSPFYNIYNGFVYNNSKASFAYLTTKKYSTDPTLIQQIKTAYKMLADEEYNYTYNNPYRVGYRMDVPSYIGWGQFAHSASRSFHLILASIVLDDAKYLEAAKINFDVELGANPQNRSYITGVGSVPPQNPLHLTSIWLRQNKGATLPVPGIPVFGPNYHASNSNDYATTIQSNANVYPSIEQDSYPILRRYFDLSGIVEQSEFGIGSISSILSAFAYFSN